MDSTALNYDPLAKTDNGTCIAFVYGCIDVNSLNYVPFSKLPYFLQSI